MLLTAPEPVLATTAAHSDPGHVERAIGFPMQLALYVDQRFDSCESQGPNLLIHRRPNAPNRTSVLLPQKNPESGRPHCCWLMTRSRGPQVSW
jgi:hypothetical protein